LNQLPEEKQGETLLLTFCAGTISVTTSALVFALLRQDIQYVRTFVRALVLVISFCYLWQVFMSVYGQKNSNPYDLWMLAEIEALLPSEMRKASVDIAKQLSVRQSIFFFSSLFFFFFLIVNISASPGYYSRLYSVLHDR
jgi:hypothetical protein